MSKHVHTKRFPRVAAMVAALSLVALPATAAFAGDTSDTGIYSKDSEKLGGADYSQLRPQGDDGNPGVVEAGDSPSAETGITGEDSRKHGGPDYSGIRPESSGDMAEQPSGPATQPNAETGIYGSDSKEHGGSDYSSLRPEDDEFAKYDEDGDGKLSRTEGAKSEQLSQSWQDMDTNNDMEIDRAEFSAFELKPDQQ